MTSQMRCHPWNMNTNQLPHSRRLAGLITTAELAASGVTDVKIRTLVRNGTLVPLARGIYARADAVAALSGSDRGSRALRLAANLLAWCPQAVGSHQDAALIHGLQLLDRPPVAISITRARSSAGSRASRARGIHLHLAELPDQHTTLSNGVRVTTVSRTVADLARTTPFKSGVVTADSALRARKTTKAELRL